MIVVGTLGCGVLLGTPATPATADGGSCVAGCTDTSTPPPTDTHTDTHSGTGSLEITVKGSYVTGGHDVTIPAGKVYKPPVCYYRFLATGQEYAAAWGPGGNYTYLVHHLPPEDQFSPYPGYKDHADDDKGGWWYPFCDSDNFTGSDKEWQDTYTKFYAAHKTTYVEVDETPPVVNTVPPRVLAEVASDYVKLTNGEIHWNPTRKGDGATFVGMKTWVWLTDTATSRSVTASIPGLSATVTSTLTGLTIHSDGAGTTTCEDGTGTPWKPGADSSCTLTFTRSSAVNASSATNGAEPTWTLTASTRWASTWTSTDGDGGDFDDQTITTDTEVPVAEIQSVVNAAG